MAHGSAVQCAVHPLAPASLFVKAADIAEHRIDTIVLQSALSDCAEELHCAVQGGSLTLNGETPLQLGITNWRTLVTYVPQTRVHPGGTPAEFYFAAQVLNRPWLPASQT